jgi:hypothetical protein
LTSKRTDSLSISFPTRLQDPSSSRFKPYKSRFIRAAEAQTAIHNNGSSVFSGTSEAGSVSSYSVSGYQSMMSMTSTDKVEAGVRVGMITPQHIPQRPALIVLKGKMGLPEGFGPLKPYQRKMAEEGGTGAGTEEGAETPSMALTSESLSKLTLSNAAVEKNKKINNKSRSKFKGGRLGRVKEDEEENSENGGGGVDDVSEGDDDDEDDSDYEQETETVNTTASVMRLRGETPEQRKVRKSLVKVEKQARRLAKKQMKNAYKDEESRQNSIVGKQQAINNVGVFKYTV